MKPPKLYLIWWQDRKDPKYKGYLGNNNTICVEGEECNLIPFYSWADVIFAADQIKDRQVTKIIEYIPRETSF